MRGFFHAMQFLTVIPVRPRGDAEGPELAASVWAFPLVGLLLGLVLAVSVFFLGLVLPQSLAIAMALLVFVILSGGLHVDGLSDTLDALARRGSREDRLAVMKSGAAGPIGVLGIVFSLGLKYLGLLASADLAPHAFYAALLLMPMVSRWAMVVTMCHGRSARPEGLGSAFIDGMRPGHLAIATGIAACSVMIPSLFAPQAAFVRAPMFAVAALSGVYVFGVLAARYFDRVFGGHTGDTVGATGECVETFYPMMVIAWEQLYI